MATKTRARTAATRTPKIPVAKPPPVVVPWPCPRDCLRLLLASTRTGRGPDRCLVRRLLGEGSCLIAPWPCEPGARPRLSQDLMDDLRAKWISSITVEATRTDEDDFHPLGVMVLRPSGIPAEQWLTLLGGRVARLIAQTTPGDEASFTICHVVPDPVGGRIPLALDPVGTRVDLAAPRTWSDRVGRLADWTFRYEPWRHTKHWCGRWDRVVEPSPETA